MIQNIVSILCHKAVGIGYSLAHPSGLKLNERCVMLFNCFGWFLSAKEKWSDHFWAAKLKANWILLTLVFL